MAWRGRRSRIILLSILCLVGIGLVCRIVFAPKRFNVLLVTLDTTRADHIGCYGYRQALTPTLDALAKDGVVFENAYATVPLTLPSHASILTGLYPPENGIHNNGRGKLDVKFATLAEMLEKRGYETGAFIGSVVLPARSGLNQGFQKYDDDMAGGERHGHEAHLMRSGRLVVDSALKWLRLKKSQPFFCWVHLYDPHAPFEGHAELFNDRFLGNEYDGDIAFADVQVGRLIKYLKEKNEYDRTIVVVVGDHGEGFGEHQELEHGFMLYNATLQVPLIVTAPGICQINHRVKTSVSLVDIYPTVLACLNLQPTTHVSGVNLAPALRGVPMHSRACYSESEACYVSFQWAPLQSIATESWKYVNTTHDELYDLEKDPRELTNLVDSNPDQLARMQQLLGSTTESMVRCAETDTPIAAKDVKQLAALGYLGSNKKSATTDTSASLPDVKEMIGFYNEEIQARKLLKSAPLQAIELLQRVVHSAPKFLPAWLSLGSALQNLQRFDEAIEAYETASTTSPDAADPRFELARLYFERGNRDKAIVNYQDVLKIDPNYAMAHVNLASILMEQGEIESARDHFKRGLESFPESTVGQFNYGVFLYQRGEFESAKRHLTRASLLDPMIPQIHYQLGKTLKALGEVDEAATQFRQTLQINPRFTDAVEQLKLIQQKQ